MAVGTRGRHGARLRVRVGREQPIAHAGQLLGLVVLALLGGGVARRQHQQSALDGGAAQVGLHLHGSGG